LGFFVFERKKLAASGRGEKCGAVSPSKIFRKEESCFYVLTMKQGRGGKKVSEMGNTVFGIRGWSRVPSDSLPFAGTNRERWFGGKKKNLRPFQAFQQGGKRGRVQLEEK